MPGLRDRWRTANSTYLPPSMAGTANITPPVTVSTAARCPVTRRGRHQRDQQGHHAGAYPDADDLVQAAPLIPAPVETCEQAGPGRQRADGQEDPDHRENTRPRGQIAGYPGCGNQAAGPRKRVITAFNDRPESPL